MSKKSFDNKMTRNHLIESNALDEAMNNGKSIKVNLGIEKSVRKAKRLNMEMAHAVQVQSPS